MKKFPILFFLSIISFISKAQTLDDVNELMGKFQYREAKNLIDKYFENPKKASDAQAWYYKGRVYIALSNDSTTAIMESYDLKIQAFDAFQKTQSLDKQDTYMKIEAYNSYLNLYYGFYELGAKGFNAKNFDLALNSFKKAIDTKDFILSKNYTYTDVKLYPLDTSLILNCAASAAQAKKNDESMSFYKILTDANISGKDYVELYQLLADYYMKKDDTANFNEIIAKAKKYYPGDDTWMDLELKEVSRKGDKTALFSKYDQLIAQNPSNFVLPYNYAVELYNSLYGKDAPNSGDTNMAKTLTTVLKKAIANENKVEITATMLMCNHLYNLASDFWNNADKIKGPKPEDLKRKANLKAAANKPMDECIQYGEIAVKFFESKSTKSDLDKANYKIVLGYMSDIYSLKKNTVKAAEYEKKNAAADRL